MGRNRKTNPCPFCPASSPSPLHHEAAPRSPLPSTQGHRFCKSTRRCPVRHKQQLRTARPSRPFSSPIPLCRSRRSASSASRLLPCPAVNLCPSCCHRKAQPSSARSHLTATASVLPTSPRRASCSDKKKRGKETTARRNKK
ncbi:hypothetical protein M0R45_030519 [Rubus argutus]|uniref:Uncharacterized protein n=1 Tax=Rubus argutus TaxID=59490 RepID=A0AAW1WBN9_RUBAR